MDLMIEKADVTPTVPSTQSRLDFLENVYNRLNQHSVHADTKAGVVLSFHYLWAFSTAFQAANLFIDFSAASQTKLVIWVLALLSLLGFVVSFARSTYTAFMIALPRLSRHPVLGTRPPSLIFFGEIATLAGGSPEERVQHYSKSLREATDETLMQDYIRRICDVSATVQAKFECASRAIRYSLLTFALWAPAFVLLVVLGQLR